ncbi:acetate--CoA ligase family protein [Oricola sp.]|uniref:acetate--CoA ligase family protein n=1 Tax=Oricola sp. TaxID=1979950 RepID=UPI003BA966BE
MKNDLKALTAPSAVALIGASDNIGKLTARPLVFMNRHGFVGKVYPVNPVRETVQGLKAYPSVEAIPDQVDHAYILLGTEDVIGAVEDCARAGVRVVSVLANGFADAGPEGAARQERLVEVARDAGIMLIGPNSTGVIDTRSGFSCTTNAAFRADTLGKGRLAVISQSGSLIGALYSRGRARGVEFATLISAGNEAGCGVGELGATLLDDDGIDGFVLFMETVRNPEALADFARRAHAAGKCIVAYMLGESDEGKALAVSHTGALTGSAEAVKAFLSSIGIATVNQFEALFEAPAALARKPRLSGRPKQATVVSTTGGGGAMVIDQLSLRGVEIAACSTAAREALTAKKIPLGHGKLVDVTMAGTNYDTMKAVVARLIADPETGVLVVAIGSSAQFNPELAVTPIVDAVAEGGDDAAPVFAFPIPHAEDSIRMLEAGGVPAFRSVEACADTIALLVNGPAPQPGVSVDIPIEARVLVERAGNGMLNEVDSGAVFATLGVTKPNQVVLPPDETAPETGDLQFPLVAKLVSGDLPHKTEAGAIRIGIKDAAELANAIADMRNTVSELKPDARIEGVLVQEMCSGLGEALIGLTRDPLVGPVVTVAAGGVMTEIYKDIAVRPAPVSLETAREMISEVKGFALLRGYRGKPKGDTGALAAAIAAVSSLAGLDTVAEAEINPLLVRREGEGIVLLDGLIRKR